MNITLKDGSVLNVQDGATALDAARQISEGLARAALSCEINGEVHDLTTPLHEGDKLSILTFNDEMGRWTLRHTAAHIMAQAVQHLYPTRALPSVRRLKTAFTTTLTAKSPLPPRTSKKSRPK